ncbi:hypothetical protein K491DRAFT_516420 [Lophiostoma macrostomum CBS 122681]|uniref:Uncharacterized protein n=1 Tax=Lophiostoma macrostomum CBS 122681 TaxID=1314788 RepID=A0A6A6T2A4_9PLEO|nr:hypothetical protein K491DRAFT_516420 [Lophiostoma macrostomum CBS 122681]
MALGQTTHTNTSPSPLTHLTIPRTELSTTIAPNPNNLRSDLPSMCLPENVTAHKNKNQHASLPNRQSYRTPHPTRQIPAPSNADHQASHTPKCASYSRFDGESMGSDATVKVKAVVKLFAGAGWRAQALHMELEGLYSWGAARRTSIMHCCDCSIFLSLE